jgi:hypothetical protein
MDQLGFEQLAAWLAGPRVVAARIAVLRDRRVNSRPSLVRDRRPVREDQLANGSLGEPGLEPGRSRSVEAPGPPVVSANRL